MTAVLAALVWTGSALPLAAQAGEPAFGEAIDVRVVNVEAVVTGKDGERVRGLTKDDFRLLVDGRDVPIGFFNEITDGTLVGIGGVEGGEVEVDSPEAETVGRRVLVFVDDSFGIAPHRNAVLDKIGQSLGKLSPQDQVAVVAFDGKKLKLLSDWTADRARISAALTEARGRRTHGMIVQAQLREINRSLGALSDVKGFTPLPVPTTVGASAGRFGQEGFDGTEFQETGGGVMIDIPYLLRQVVTASAAAMRAVSIPEKQGGRKVMLLLSGGWPMLEYSSPQGLLDARSLSQDWLDSFGGVGQALFQPLVDTANRLGYTIYPVDMPGLGVGTAADVRETDFSNNRMVSSPWDQATDAALNYLAEETGGRASVNSARLEALDRMAEDTRSYYWFGFTPAWKADDRHHRIEVVARRPGLKVRARSGFTDMSNRTEMAMSTEGLLLFGSKDETPEGKLIQVEMGTPERVGLSVVKVPVTLSIPAESLTLLPVAGGFAAEASLSVGALDRWGSRSDLPVQRVRLNFDRQPKPGDIVRYRTMVRMSRGRQQVVFTLRDALSGEMLWAKLDYKP
ncbi:MAG TPA: VWA domain-containing protein [Thermoanaerobaculia bacterium]|jgi:VWFA-related protein|nr:VWA domain-containing protein [Thermoanaerobaculia bacterium]